MTRRKLATVCHPAGALFHRKKQWCKEQQGPYGMTMRRSASWPQNFYGITGGYRAIFLVLSLGLPPLTTTPLSAQDLSTTLQAMRDRYANSSGLHLVMDIRAYDSEAATTPFFAQQAEIKKAGDDYRYHYQDQEVLLNKHVSLIVDKQHQVITCQPRDKTAEAALATLPFADLDSLLSAYGSPSFAGKENGLDHYVLARPEGEIARVGLWLDTLSQLLRKLTYHYRNGSRVVIDFTTLTMDPVFASQTFSETAFVTRKRKTWQPTATYAHYRIVQP